MKRLAVKFCISALFCINGLVSASCLAGPPSLQCYTYTHPHTGKSVINAPFALRSHWRTSSPINQSLIHATLSLSVLLFNSLITQSLAELWKQEQIYNPAWNPLSQRLYKRRSGREWDNEVEESIVRETGSGHAEQQEAQNMKNRCMLWCETICIYSVWYVSWSLSRNKPRQDV